MNPFDSLKSSAFKFQGDKNSGQSKNPFFNNSLPSVPPANNVKSIDPSKQNSVKEPSFSTHKEASAKSNQQVKATNKGDSIDSGTTKKDQKNPNNQPNMIFQNFMKNTEGQTKPQNSFKLFGQTTQGSGNSFKFGAKDQSQNKIFNSGEQKKQKNFLDEKSSVFGGFNFQNNSTTPNVFTKNFNTDSQPLNNDKFSFSGKHKGEQKQKKFPVESTYPTQNISGTQTIGNTEIIKQKKLQTNSSPSMGLGLFINTQKKQQINKQNIENNKKTDTIQETRKQDPIQKDKKSQNIIPTDTKQKDSSNGKFENILTPNFGPKSTFKQQTFADTPLKTTKSINQEIQLPSFNKNQNMTPKQLGTVEKPKDNSSLQTKLNKPQGITFSSGLFMNNNSSNGSSTLQSQPISFIQPKINTQKQVKPPTISTSQPNNQSKSQAPPTFSTQDAPSRSKHFNLDQLGDILTQKGESSLSKEDKRKIQISLKNYMDFRVDFKITSQNSKPINFVENISPQQGINRVLNDFTCLILLNLQISSQAYVGIGRLFHSMIKQYKLTEQLFKDNQVKQQAILKFKIYRYDNKSLVFQPNQQQTINILFQFTNYFFGKIKNCLDGAKKMPRFLAEFKMLEFWFEKLIVLGKRNPSTTSPELFKLLKQFDYKLIFALEQIIVQWIKTKKIVKILTKDKLQGLMKSIDELPVGQVSLIAQKIILQLVFSQKMQQKQLRKYFSKTTSDILLPFRLLYSSDKYYGSSITKVVQGSHWIDWMQQYLGNNKDYSQEQINNLILSLGSFHVQSTHKIIDSSNHRNIVKFIYNLRYYHNSITNFYQLLSSVINSNQMFQELQKQLFVGDNTIIKQLRPLVMKIMKYPECEFGQDDIEQMKSKTIFFLSIVKYSIEKVFEFENAFFDIHGFANQRSIRCDRICHTVLDLLAFFTNNYFCQQILITSLEAIMSLLTDESTRICMSLAMNVNKPELSFLKKNISQSSISKLGEFLIYMLNTRQFYDSVRSPDMSIISTRAYPLRYDIQKYLLATNNHKTTIPVYWFSHGLRVLTKQTFNPKLIYSILSKLLILPSPDIQSYQKPYILQTIVESCTSEHFWIDITQNFQTQAILYQRSLLLENKIIEDFRKNYVPTKNKEVQPLSKIFYSLKILKTLFELKGIVEIGQNNSPRHFITILLSNLKCLSDAERHFIYGSQISDYSNISYNNRVSPLIDLLALTKYRSYKFNHTFESKHKQWNYVNSDGFDTKKLLNIFKEIKGSLDYYVMHDLLIHPNNKYIQNHDSIAGLAFDCLAYIVTNTTEINIEAALYAATPSRQDDLRIEVISWEKLIIEDIVQAMHNEDRNLSVSSWKFVLSLKKTYRNKNLASQIFRNYIIKQPKLSSYNSVNKIIAQFILEEYKENKFAHSQQVTILLNKINQLGGVKSDLEKLCVIYERKNFIHSASLHEFERMAIQREMTFTIQLYQQIQILAQIILRAFYASRHESQEQSSKLTSFIAVNKLLSFFKGEGYYLENDNQNLTESENDRTKDHIEIKIREKRKIHQWALRTQGQDSLNAYLVKKSFTREDALQNQKNNVLKFAKLQMGKLTESLSQFFSVMLSVDDTFYANHPIQTESRHFSDIFCQLHMKQLSVKADYIFGKNIEESADNIRKCIEACLQKIQKIRDESISTQMLETFTLLDLLINWFHSNSKKIIQKTKSSKKIRAQKYSIELAQRIVSVCFTWLGEAIIHEVPAKLLLTLVTILQNSLTVETKILIKRTVYKTIINEDVLASEIKQYILPLLILVPPTNNQSHLINQVVKMWVSQQQDQYFYNLSRVMLKLCEIHPIQICKTKLLRKCSRLFSLSDKQYPYYQDGMRTSQSLSWLWILKIVTCLAYSLNSSTIIIYELNQFFKRHKKLLLLPLNEPRNQILAEGSSNERFRTKSRYTSAPTSLVTKKQSILNISLAQFDELEFTLEFLVCLFSCDMWVLLNRQSFQQILYCILHRTVFAFMGSGSTIMSICVNKRYLPFSDCEKAMWNMNLTEDTIKQEFRSSLDRTRSKAMDEEITSNMINSVSSHNNPTVFLLLMSIKNQDCSRVWLSACCAGMKNSYFTREYFQSPICIDNKGNILRYSMIYWEHLNKTLNSILKEDIKRIQKWNSWEKTNKLLELLRDSFKSAQFFLQFGYLNTTVTLPTNSNDLMYSLSSSICLTLQMSSYHLLSQVDFKRKNGTLVTSNLKNFQSTMSKLSQQAQKLLNKFKKDENVIENIIYGRQLLDSIPIS